MPKKPNQNRLVAVPNEDDQINQSVTVPSVCDRRGGKRGVSGLFGLTV
jgi:hypothetical protein